jgi:hypothetical protein
MQRRKTLFKTSKIGIEAIAIPILQQGEEVGLNSWHNLSK